MQKTFITFVILSGFTILQTYGQSPVDVVENTIKVKGFGEEVFYYGFAERDQLIFNFGEVNGKELKEIEIIEMPGSSKFGDYKSKKIENKTLHIPYTSIYKFRFANSTINRRICKFKIQRIPANETAKNFNTNVYWQTISDTTWQTKTRQVLVKTDFKIKSFLGTKIFHANADEETSKSNTTAGHFSTSHTQSLKIDRVLRPEVFI